MEEDLTLLQQMKYVYRYRSVIFSGRQESDAEHTNACGYIADHFLQWYPKLDELRVHGMLRYHDCPEIKYGDAFYLDEQAIKERDIKEIETIGELVRTLPSGIKQKFQKYYLEFARAETFESKFAIAIDKYEPVVFLSMYPNELKSFNMSESEVRAKKDPYFEPFPEIMTRWNSWLEDKVRKNLIKK